MQPAKIGPYPVVRTLGSGAFGTVYLAQHPTAHVPVAIKALDRLQAEDSQLRAQLRQEVAALTAVRSPYCLQVSDVIDDGSALAFVTEYVPGATLRTILDAHGALTAPVALQVLWGAANGLAAVHSAGLVHGDVKPANILLDAHGRSKIIDFGLTSAPGGLRGDELSPYGSPAYASPEQLAHGYRDARSDIYSLSATLYEVLTQQRPFSGRSLAELTAAHTTQPVPDPRALVPDVGDDLAGLILAGLAKDPAHRPQDMTMFLTWFERAATARWGGTWRTAAGLAGIVGGVAAVSGLASGVYVASTSAAAAGAAGAGAAGAGTGVTAGTGVAAGTSASGGISAAGAGSLLTGKVALIATGTILAVGAATTGIVIATSGDGNSPTTFNYLSAPTHDWYRTWSEVVPGGQLAWLGSHGQRQIVETYPGATVAVLTDGNGALTTVSLAASDGHTLWTRHQFCEPVDHAAIICGDEIVDPASNRVLTKLGHPADSATSAIRTPAGVYMTWMVPEEDGGHVTTSGEGGLLDAKVALFSASDGHQIWSHDLTAGGSTVNDHQEFPYVSWAPDGVSINWSSWGWLYSAGGDLVTKTPTASGDGLGSESIVGGYVVGELYDGDSATVSVFDPRTNAVIARGTGTSWSPESAMIPARNQIGIGNTVYDLPSGHVAWTTTDDSGGQQFIGTEDGSYALSEGSGEGSPAQIIDGSNGQPLWTFTESGSSRVDIVGNAAIQLSGNVMIGNDPDGGVQKWRRALSLPDSGDTAFNTTGGSGQVAAYFDGGIEVLSGFSTISVDEGNGGSTQTATGGGTAYTTACGSEPVFTPIAAKPGTDGDGEVVTYKITATCPGGQYLRASQYEVPFYAGESLYLDSYFDFSGNPMFIPDSGTEIALSYPARNTYSDNYEVNKAIRDDNGSGTVIRVPCTPGPDSTEAPAPQAPPSATPSAASAPSTAASELPQTPEQASEDAKAALDRWVRTDRPFIQNYQGQWLTQLSSKGYVDGAFVPADYTSYAQILQTFLRYRQLYPDEARLVWSNDWPGTYGPKSRGLYVLVRAVPYASTDEVNAWCASEQWGRGDCFGTRLATGEFDNSNHSFQPKN